MLTAKNAPRAAASRRSSRPDRRADRLRTPRGGYIPARQRAARSTTRRNMRAEIQAIVDEIKQSIGLLRRHL